MAHGLTIFLHYNRFITIFIQEGKMNKLPVIVTEGLTRHFDNIN